MSDVQLIFDLSKATKDKTKLVQKQVQVTRGGKTFIQTVWVNPSQATSSQSSGIVFDFSEFEKLKSDKVKALQYLKDNGITWQEHNHSGVNWMRACMAASKAGGISKQSNSPNKTAKTPKSDVSKTVPKLDYNKLSSNGYDNFDGKKKTASIKKEMSKDEFISLASSVVSWTPSNHPAVNLMRASMEFKKWCDTHSLDDLQAALKGQDVQVKQQADKPAEPPKPKEELEVQPNHTERQKNMIKIINSITDEKDLEDFTSAGMVPEDDTAKSFIVDKLLKEYNTHIRPNISGTGRASGRYHSIPELRKDFVNNTSKLYKGVLGKIVDYSIYDVASGNILLDFVDPRHGTQINNRTKRNYSKNTNMSNMIESLQSHFGGYADYDDNDTNNSPSMNTSLQDNWDIEESKKKYDVEKDGFAMALKRIGEFDSSLKPQVDDMLKTYGEMMDLTGCNPKLFRYVGNTSYDMLLEELDKEKTQFYKTKTLIEELKKHGLSNDDIKYTIYMNHMHSRKPDRLVLYKNKSTVGFVYSMNGCEPLLDALGDEVTIDLTKLYRPDTGELLWDDVQQQVFGYSAWGGRLELYETIDSVDTKDFSSSKLTALKTITSEKYDKFVKLQCKLYGVQLQDSNSQSIVDTEPHTWSYNDVSTFRAIKDGDNEELDSVITNLSFIISISNMNHTIADRIYHSRYSAANKLGEDYSGNFTYHGYDFGRHKTQGSNPQELSPDQKRAVLKQQLDDVPLFTKDELAVLKDYVNNNGDPTKDASYYSYPQLASETLSRIRSLSPMYQGWDGIKGTPIDDIFMRCIEASVQYCPQVYNARVKNKEDLKKWLYKQTGFTPYQPPQTSTNTQQTAVNGTKLYELRKQLFDKAHCSIRTANSQEYADITHKVKMDFDYVDPKTGKRVPKAERAYDKRALALHGNVYVINNSEARDNFQKEAARLNETPVQMYHGTSYGGGCGIVGVEGRFRISGKETQGMQTSGSMLGQGIYMAKLVGKTLPYLGNGKYSYQNYNIDKQAGTTTDYKADGCLLVCDAVLGKHYHSDISTSDAARHNNGTYDSVAAGAGVRMGPGSSLKEYECIVRRNNQVAPKYIVDCGGRVR